jgi:hypothetical protein
MCSNLCLQITFLVWKTKCFPLLFTFFVTESTENWSEGRKGRRGKYGSFSFLHFFHTFLFSLFLPRADSLKIWSQKSKQKRKFFLKNTRNVIWKHKFVIALLLPACARITLGFAHCFSSPILERQKISYYKVLQDKIWQDFFWMFITTNCNFFMGIPS